MGVGGGAHSSTDGKSLLTIYARKVIAAQLHVKSPYKLPPHSSHKLALASHNRAREAQDETNKLNSPLLTERARRSVLLSVHNRTPQYAGRRLSEFLDSVNLSWVVQHVIRHAPIHPVCEHNGESIRDQ